MTIYRGPHLCVELVQPGLILLIHVIVSHNVSHCLLHVHVLRTWSGHSIRRAEHMSTCGNRSGGHTCGDVVACHAEDATSAALRFESIQTQHIISTSHQMTDLSRSPKTIPCTIPTMHGSPIDLSHAWQQSQRVPLIKGDRSTSNWRHCSRCKLLAHSNQHAGLLHDYYSTHKNKQSTMPTCGRCAPGSGSTRLWLGPAQHSAPLCGWCHHNPPHPAPA